MKNILLTFLLCLLPTAVFAGGTTAPVQPGQYAPGVQTLTVQAQEYTTTSDAVPPSTDPTGAGTLQSLTPPAFAPMVSPSPMDITVYPGDQQQQFLGVGGSLSYASGYVLWNDMSSSQRTALLTTLYSPSQANFSFLRACFGPDDFRQTASGYTYDDMTGSQTDSSLNNFSIAKDTAYQIPIYQQVLAINPRCRIPAAVWQPPAWMLTSGTFDQNHQVFNDSNMAALSTYIVKAIQAYNSFGIPIWSVDINEPSGGVHLTFSAAEEVSLYQILGPALLNAGLTTKILAFDDSWPGDSNTTYPTTVLSDATVQQYIGGTAYHGYAGSPKVMSLLHGQYPGQDIYFTEWRSLTSETIAEDMQEMAGGLIVGATRNWCKSVNLWNLVLDQNTGPYLGVDTANCSGRRGVVTVNNSTGAVTYNMEYYALRQLSQFLQPGAVHCTSTTHDVPYKAYTTYPTNLVSTSFVNPDGSIVLYVYDGVGLTSPQSGALPNTTQTFNIIDGRSGLAFPVSMVPGQVATFVWGTSSQNSPAVAAATLTPPSAPTLTATGAAGQINLTITPPSSTYGVNYYNILKGATTGTETQLVQVPASTTTYSDLLGGVGTPFYKVNAVSIGGTSANSTEQTATSTAAAVPSAPTSLATSGGAGTTLLTWLASTPNGTAVTSYNVVRGTSSGAETSLGTTTQGTLTYTDATTSAGTTYYYEVAGVNTTGTSAVSNEATFFIAGNLTPTADTSSVSGVFANGSASATWTHTTGTLTHGLLVVAVGFSKNGSSISTVTYGGQSLTKLTTADANPASSTDRSEDLWYLKNPPSGANSIVVTPNQTSTAMNCIAVTYSNVNQTTPFRTAVTSAGSANTSSMTTTGGAATDIVLSMIHARTSVDVSATGSGQSIVRFTRVTTDDEALSAQAGGTGSIVSSWSWTTPDNQAAISVALIGG